MSTRNIQLLGWLGLLFLLGLFLYGGLWVAEMGRKIDRNEAMITAIRTDQVGRTERFNRLFEDARVCRDVVEQLFNQESRKVATKEGM